MLTKRDVFFISLTFTFAILFFGLLFGILIYNYQTFTVNKILYDFKMDAQDIMYVSQNITNDFDNNFDCNFYSQQLNILGKNIFENGKLINQYYNKEHDLNKIKELQKQYVLAMLFLSDAIKKYNNICTNYKKNMIIYVYPYDCTNCGGLSKKLSDLAKTKNTIIFSIPGQIELNSVKYLLNKHKITTLPSTIVNNQVLEGPYTYDKIENYLR